MHVDFKITVWERVDVPEQFKELVTEKLQDGTIQNANDLIELMSGDSCSSEQLVDTCEQLTPSENTHNATIELWDRVEGPENKDPLKITWDNTYTTYRTEDGHLKADCQQCEGSEHLQILLDNGHCQACELLMNSNQN